MNTPAPPPPASDVATAAAALQALDRLTGDIRRELAEVRRDIARDAARYSDARCAQLLEANEQLLQATMKAERRADEAAAELEEVTRASQFDALTEMPNRSLMRDRLGEALVMARRHRACLALLFVDLDGFKEINDTAGHAVGDEVLKRMARRLHDAVRESDTVSRRGGDEFLVLLPEVADREAAARIARKMLQVVAEPMTVDARVFRLSASIGIAMWPGDGDEPGTLIGRADQAMYDAKRAGRNTYCFADASPAPTDADASASATASASPSGTGRAPTPAPSPRDALLVNLRDANEQLLLAALRAQELLDASEFARDRHAQAVAVLAHELRNPLAPIRTAGQLLLAISPQDARIGNVGQMIDRQIAQMSRLIDDLLDGARASSAGFRLRPEPVSLREVLERSIQAAEAAMLARRQTLTARLPPPSVILQADPMRLEQVFSNLLDNASKYTPAQGHVELGVAQDEGWVTVTVVDDGIGISPQALTHIFDLFVQEQSAREQDRSGLGIGLAVVRELVHAHGGTVQARSAGQGRGSEFVVRLPCDPAPQAAPPA